MTATDPRPARRRALLGAGLALALIGSRGGTAPARWPTVSAAPLSLHLGLGQVVRLSVEIGLPGAR